MPANAARDVDQRHTRRLQFPHVELPIAAGGIWQKSTQNLSTQHSTLVFSLLFVKKHLLAKPRFQREIRFKPLFFLWGSKVPQKQKQAVRKRAHRKYIYK
jgi:hypothetical protein